ncbi:MAG: outer membrane protein assembly factor BamA [Acidobacteriota bacterium]|nr:outer membrane protein assembly factor BamA [Acidobacteriota bacterium]
MAVFAFRAALAQSPPPTPTPASTPSGASAFGIREDSPLSGTMPMPAMSLAPVAETAGPAASRPKIVQIVVRGGKTTAPETVGFYLGVKVGDPYDDLQIKRSFGKLWDSGLFEDVTLEKEESPAGVVLVATVVERPIVADLEFRGNKKLTTSQLKDKLKEGKAEIRVGAPVSLRDVAKAKTVLLDAYKAEGFRSVAIDASTENVSEMQRRIVFLIDEGDKMLIESIVFSGNTVFGQTKLRYAIKKTKQAHWWRFFDSKSTFNQAGYEEDVETLRKVYQDAGYKDVVIKDPVLDVFVTNPAEKRPEKIKRRVRITIPIVEGEKFFFGKVTVEGSVVFRPDQLERFFGYRAGKPMSRAVIAEGMKAIDATYRSRGYIYVFMNPENTEKPNHVVDVVVKVTEGDQYRLGRIEFTGNKTTRDKVLRRELQVFEGDIMDMETFKKSLFKVTQLGYFKIEEDPDFRVNPEKKTVDVSIKGTDTNRNEVQFGAGYSQLDGLFGQFQFNTRNFLGRGDNLGIQFQRGNRSNFFDVSFAEPWFLDQRMSIGGSIFNRTLDYSDVAGGLDQKSKGLSLSLGYGLGIFDLVSIFYAYTDTQSTYQVYPPPPPPGGGAVPVAFATYFGKTSGITPGYRYDSRNDPFDPSRGMRIGAALSISGGPFGGNFSYYKLAATVTRYIPFGKKANFALNLDVGYLRGYGGEQDPNELNSDSQIPLFDRYRIGGDRSVRGFKFGSIYPLNDKDEAFFTSTGALLGGNRFLVFNFEYVYQLAGPLKLAAFFDAGNTWLEGQSASLGSMRTSTGLEMRVFLPIFQAPLRFIYGINLRPKDINDAAGRVIQTESKTDFQFSIGTTF